MRTGSGASIPRIARRPKRNSATPSPPRCANTPCSTGSFVPATARHAGFRSNPPSSATKMAEAVRLVGAHTDVTEQVVAEQALRQSEERYRKLADQLAELNATLAQRVEEKTRERDRIWNVSQDLLVVADRNGVWQTVNPAWTRTLGWSEAELLEPHLGMAGASRRRRTSRRRRSKSSAPAGPPCGSKAAFVTRTAPTAGCHGRGYRTGIASMRSPAT